MVIHLFDELKKLLLSLNIKLSLTKNFVKNMDKMRDFAYIQSEFTGMSNAKVKGGNNHWSSNQESTQFWKKLKCSELTAWEAFALVFKGNLGNKKG